MLTFNVGQKDGALKKKSTKFEETIIRFIKVTKNISSCNLTFINCKHSQPTGSIRRTKEEKSTRLVITFIQKKQLVLCEVTPVRTTLPVLQVHPKGKVGNNDPSVRSWHLANF